VDEWADPVENDSAEVAVLRPMLKNTNLEFRGLRLTYSANRDGWNAAAFHEKVDKQGGGMGSGLIAITIDDGRSLIIIAVSYVLAQAWLFVRHWMGWYVVGTIQKVRNERGK
jgi:hypothetical protein